MRYINLTVAIIEIFWPIALSMSFIGCMAAKYIKDEMDYKDFKRGEHGRNKRGGLKGRKHNQN